MFGQKALAPWLKIELAELPDGRFQVLWDDPNQRPCGDCTLCCRVVPVAELNKPANRWCRHADAKRGCRIYDTRPGSCRHWSCLWTATPAWPDELKPNKSHVIFDMLTDGIHLRNNETGEIQEMSAIQLWVDPVYPGAHRAPEVRKMIAFIAEHYRLPTLVRIGSAQGIFVLAPSLSSDGQWHEKEAPATPIKELA